MTTRVLPPLPAADMSACGDHGLDIWLYTAKTLQEYARTAIDANLRAVEGSPESGSRITPDAPASPAPPQGEREAFEAAISASPYERSVVRFPDNDSSAWPGCYRDIEVDLAWRMWQARASLRASTQPAPSAQGPAELWLQLHGDCHESELSEPVDYTGDDVTWCWHPIHASDVRYVRADPVAPQSAPDQREAVQPVAKVEDGQLAWVRFPRDFTGDLYAAPQPAPEPQGEREAFEAWSINERLAYRDSQHGICFYDVGGKAWAWRAWQARASLSASTPSAAVPEFNGWYCAHCQRGVDSSEVTFHEQHQECGRVITNDRPPQPAMSAEARDGLLRDARDELETLCVGLEWNIENHPEVMNDSDSEALAKARAFVDRLDTFIDQQDAAKAPPADNKENGNV